MNHKQIAKELREHADQLNEQITSLQDKADALLNAADVLDPPRPKRPKRRDNMEKARAALAAKRAAAKAQKPASVDGANGERQRPTTLALGTSGRTSHPSDPDAGAIRDSLVHTTQEPAS